MKRKTVFTLCAIMFLSVTITLLWLPGQAQADWTRTGSKVSVGNIDKFELFITEGSGTHYQDPGIGNFSLSSWSGETINPDYVLALGEISPDVLSFDQYFTGAQSQTFNLNILFWDGDTFNGGEKFAWDGTELEFDFLENITDSTGFNRSAPVPEPSTLLLFGAGLVGLVGWRWRRK